MCESIKQFGFTQPILIDENNIVLAGHGRLMAAQKIGLSSVPVVKIKDMPEHKKKAYVIADNKIAENSKWNQDVLKIEIDEISKFDIDIDVLAFSEKELSKIFDEFSDVKIDNFADDVPENPTIVIECRKEDIYQLIDQINVVIDNYKDAKVIYHNEQI